MELDNQIELYRKLHDWTQPQLAHRIGVHYSTVVRIENNQVEPKISTVMKLAKVFNIPLDEVIYPKDERPKLRLPEGM